MVENQSSVSSSVEQVDELCVTRQVGANTLEGKYLMKALQAEVLGEIHVRHAAAIDAIEDDVLAE